MTNKTIISLENMIFTKLMKLKFTSMQYVDPGKIVNLATVDVMIV